LIGEGIPDIDRNIDADEDRAFSGFLTRSETLNLIEGLWYITGVLTNVGTDEQEEIPVRFQVSQSWAIVDKVAIVTFLPLPPGPLIADSTTITLSTITPNAQIRFTQDGREPNSNSTIFTGPFTLSITESTVKAFAEKKGLENSVIATAIYTVNL